MNRKKRNIIICSISLLIVVVIALLFPKLNYLLGEKFYCDVYDLDTNNGLLKRTPFVFYCSLDSSIEETLFSKLLSEYGLNDLPSKWQPFSLVMIGDNRITQKSKGEMLSIANNMVVLIKMVDIEECYKKKTVKNFLASYRAEDILKMEKDYQTLKQKLSPKERKFNESSGSDQNGTYLRQ